MIYHRSCTKMDKLILESLLKMMNFQLLIISKCIFGNLASKGTTPKVMSTYNASQTLQANGTWNVMSR